jgi:outer membrane protein
MKGEVFMFNVPSSIVGASRPIPWVLLGMALILLPPHDVIAQGPEAGTMLSLPDAVRMALENNHELLAQKEGLLAQEKDTGVARSMLLPKVSVEERYLRTTTPGYAFMSRLNQERITSSDFNPDLLNHPDPIDDYQTTVAVEQPLYMQKALIGLSMSKKETQARAEDLRRKKEETAFSVVRAFLMVQSAREYAGAVARGISEAEENARIAGLRYKNGLGHYADTLRTSTALMEARQRSNAANKNLALARETLGLLTAAGGPVDAADGPVDLSLHDLDHYTQKAQARSDIRAASLRGENARKNISLAEAGYLPYLGVGGAYQLDDHDAPFGSEGKSWQVSAFLRWDLFDGTKREYERAKARHLAGQADQSLLAMRQGVSYRIREAYLNVEEAGKNSELARQGLGTAEEGTRLLRLRYQNGLASLADLLSSQASLEEARAGVVGRDNALKTAVASLSFESGTILEDLHVGE